LIHSVQGAADANDDIVNEEESDSEDSSSDASESDPGETLYEVEAILDRKLDPGTGTYQYKIGWRGHPESQ
jgi:hypothetical protein